MIPKIKKKNKIRKTIRIVNYEEHKKNITKCNETNIKKHNEKDDKELQDELKESTDDNKEINKEEDSQDDVDDTFEKGNRS